MRQRAQPVVKRLEEIALLALGPAVEPTVAPVDGQANALVAGDHLLQAEPPQLAQPVRKTRRNIDRERRVVPHQHRIGMREKVAVAAVERQTHEAALLWRSVAQPSHDFFDRYDVELPPLQRDQRAIEKLRRDLVGAQRLKPAPGTRSHALEPQNDPDAAGPPRKNASDPGEIAEFEPEARQRAFPSRHLR